MFDFIGFYRLVGNRVQLNAVLQQVAELKAQNESLRAELKAQNENLRAVVERLRGLETQRATQVALATRP
jgi:hypothetical protein